MEEQNKDYYLIEVDNEAISTLKSNSNFSRFLNVEDHSLDVCFSVKILSVCVKQADSERVVITVEAAGLIKLVTLTLTPNDACAKFDESLGGDAARVKVEICADFANKELRIAGRVCAAFICARFRNKIISW